MKEKLFWVFVLVASSLGIAFLGHITWNLLMILSLTMITHDAFTA